MNTLDYHKNAFNRVGWFIPPYVSMGFATSFAQDIHNSEAPFEQDKLEAVLALIYSADNLAAMVCERYPITHFIQNYKQIISESVAAHFLGLHHLAAAGIMPAIEGAAIKIATSMLLPTNISCANLLKSLATECKSRAIQNNIGAVGEILSMMDSFIEFTGKYLYEHAALYPLDDKTNRHGILHGAYSDDDYGRPINFYKCIATIDFLCFAAGFSSGYMPCFAPDHTPKSQLLASSYKNSETIGKQVLP